MMFDRFYKQKKPDDNGFFLQSLSSSTYLILKLYFFWNKIYISLFDTVILFGSRYSTLRSLQVLGSLRFWDETTNKYFKHIICFLSSIYNL